MRRLVSAALCTIALLAIHRVHAEPAIHILNVPDYGMPGNLTGVVSGVDVNNFAVATYAHIEGLGWSTEPSLASRTVALNSDGTFSVPFGAIGPDNRATIFATALVPKGYVPPAAIPSGGTGRIPVDLQSLAIDTRQRFSRTADFAGYEWGIKQSPGGAGPGSNRFSNSPQDVFVDQKGLHLTVNRHNDAWFATEVINTKPLGYGTYVVQTDSRVDHLDAMIAFGAFTWDAFGDATTGPTPNREIDLEDARFGFGGDPTSSQFVVQPFSTPGQLLRYTVPDQGGDPTLTRIIVWTPQGIRFLALRGHHTANDFSAADIIAQWDYTGPIPDPGRAAFRFNLWPTNVLLGGSVNEPLSGLPQEIIISDFIFTPVPEASVWVSLGAGLGWLAICMAYQRGSRLRGRGAAEW